MLKLTKHMLIVVAALLALAAGSFAVDGATSSPNRRVVDLTNDHGLRAPTDRDGCTTVYYYDDTCTYGYAWPLPQDSSDWFAVRFTNEQAAVCTLTTVRVKLYRPFMTGTPDLQMGVWDDDGFGLPGTLLATETVSYASLPSENFGWAEADFSPHGLIAGTGSEFHIGITTIGGEGDTLFPLTDAGTGPHAGENRSETHFQGDGLWYTLYDFSGYDFVFMIEAELCPQWGTICGRKFNDLNGNGIDDGEPGLAGWTIKLWDGSNLSTVVTGLNGEYCFYNLAYGDYWILESQQPGWTQTYPISVFHKVNIPNDGINVQGVDFGNFVCEEEETSWDTCFAGTVDNFVGAEPTSPNPGLLVQMGLSYSGANPWFDSASVNQGWGHTFENCWSDCPVISATLCIRLKATGPIPSTDGIGLGDWRADGIGRIWSLSMNNLISYHTGGLDNSWDYGDTMTVCLDLANLPSHAWLPTNVLGTLQDGDLDIYIQDDTEVDWVELFVEVCCPDSTGTIEGCKFYDEDCDGVWALGETGIPNWPIELYQIPGWTLVGQTTTDQTGCFSFDHVVPGDYRVLEVQNPAYVQTTPTMVFHAVQLSAYQIITGLEFGNCDTMCVDGEIMYDTCLAGKDDNFDTSDGPESSSPSADLLAFLQQQYDYTTEFDHPTTNQAFGHTFEGCWDPDCCVLEAELCMRLKATGQIPSTDALNLGDWSQDGGIYSISLPNLNGYATGNYSWVNGDILTVCLDLKNLPVQGSVPRNILAALQDGTLDIFIQDDTEIDFMELRLKLCCDSTGTIEGCKFYDEDCDGVWGLGETGIPNWPMELYQVPGWTLVGQTTTDQTGCFSFDHVAPGNYRVLEVQNPAYVQTTPTMVFHAVQLSAYQIISGLEFGNCDTLCEDGEIMYDTCLAGNDDFFDTSDGPEPSSPSVDLLALLQQQYDYITEFDVPATNQAFGHTFEGCWDPDCCVLEAQLYMRLKATGAIPSTDWLSLGDWSQGGTIYNISLPNLNGGNWVYGNIISVVLDLKNLPIQGNGPKNILAALQDGTLDVFIQDDTEVDFLELRVKLCCDTSCCHIRGDIDHNGAGPDIADLIYLVNFMFQNGPEPPCMEETDVNGDGTPQPDIADLIYLVSFMFQEGPDLIPCGQSAPKLAFHSHSDEIELSTAFHDGVTEISLASPFDLLGLQLELRGENLGEPELLLTEPLEMIYGHDGRTLKMGILDMRGAGAIGSGEVAVVRIPGHYEVVTALAADRQLRSIEAVISTASRRGVIPDRFALGQNYPNPFNPTTEIEFSLPAAGPAKLVVYNIVGQVVTTLVDETLPAGSHSAIWDASNTASGVYFYRLTAGNEVESRKMMLLK